MLSIAAALSGRGVEIRSTKQGKTRASGRPASLTFDPKLKGVAEMSRKRLRSGTSWRTIV